MDERDLEINAFGKLKEGLEPLDTEARLRVLAWANSKFLPENRVVSKDSKKQTFDNAQINAGIEEIIAHGDFEDLAELDKDGNLDLHIRCFKAKNKLDCVNRLVHVVIYLYEKLTGVREIPGPMVKKFLEDWRIYDGNARTFLADHKGIKSKGTRGAQRSYHLDNPGKKEAEKFISEIRDESVKGKFDPTKSQRKKLKKSLNN